jgi:hypothetical protein
VLFPYWPTATGLHSASTIGHSTLDERSGVVTIV